MDNEMIERVAEKLRAECLTIFGTTWNNDVSKRFALVAIKAMREPTEKIKAVKTMSITYSSSEIWRAMIDAITGDE